MRRTLAILRWTFVTLGVLLLTSVTIDATTSYHVSQSALAILAHKATTEGCGPGMVEVSTVPTLTCVDTYEVSADQSCPFPNPKNAIETQKDIDAGCKGNSQANLYPWTFISREQAAQVCALSGARLPTADEWGALSLGIIAPDESCNVHSNILAKTGANPECKTPNGLYDMVGNVWEWVSDDVINGTYNAHKLPETGYVAQVDKGGVATLTTQTGQIMFGSDYFWSNDQGAYGVIRGGYYGSQTDGGVYAVHADTPPTSAGVAIGFRCVK